MPKRSYNNQKGSYPSDYQHPSEKSPTELTVPDGVHNIDLMKVPSSALLEMHGIKPKYLINEYMKIVNQDDDLSNKLKALTPLMREIGINTSPTDTDSKITNNIFVMPAEITKKFNLTPIETTPIEQKDEPIVIDV